MKQNQRIKMWYTVRQMWEKGFNKSQISRELGIDRGTVRKYISMEESMYSDHIQRLNRMPKKLKKYYRYVENLLEAHPYLSAAQVEDRLKEDHLDLPCVHSKTVYNFVMSVRTESGIPKPKTEGYREYEQIAESPYGKQCQVDFGEKWMKAHFGKQKVHFISFVLSRSRYKYVELQTNPYTAAQAVQSHQRAFEFYGGVPEEVLYDQDKVFIVNENLGDVVLTQTFKRYVELEGFKTIFCRKGDPETKGKVENVVKYVKNNFLKGREFTTIEQLNYKCLKWLSRTANTKRHGTTHLVPKEEWEIEKAYLNPQRQSHIHSSTANDYKPYKVRKDNTIAYRGNHYTVPTGTYQNTHSTVLLKADNGRLYLSDPKTWELLADHRIEVLKGKLIRNTDHNRDKTSTVIEKARYILEKLENDERCQVFLERIHQDKPRYFHDHLRTLKSLLKEYEAEQVKKAIVKCLESNANNANDVKQLLDKQKPETPLFIDTLDKSPSMDCFLKEKSRIQPQKSSIDIYENILQPTIEK